MASTIYNAVPVLITFFSFLIYTLAEKKLVNSVAFTAISLFTLLRMPFDLFAEMFARVQESLVSIQRMDRFLNEEETEKYEQLGNDNCDENGVKMIGVRAVTLSWAGSNAKIESSTMAFRLLDLNVNFLIGKLNIIAGPTGLGKTSMLMGLLGENDTHPRNSLLSWRTWSRGGACRCPHWSGRYHHLRHSECVAHERKRQRQYNIPFNEKRYHDTIRACALERDHL